MVKKSLKRTLRREIDQQRLPGDRKDENPASFSPVAPKKLGPKTIQLFEFIKDSTSLTKKLSTTPLMCTAIASSKHAKVKD